MPPLDPKLRSTLEKRIVEARDASEAAARTALEALAVHEAKPYPSLSEEDRRLRKLLRAKARVLGTNAERDLSPLVDELAYVRWHRFLFARFLAENDLLMHPDYEGVSVSMADCAELAPEEGDADGWMTASRYAQRMLPGVFPPDDPLLSVRFFSEGRRAMISAMEGIPKPAFSSDDGLRWTYQFWQTKAKKEVNASGRKIGGRDLPAVTQLFTEDYMVEFLLHNSLGAWYAARHPESPLVETFSYLRRHGDFDPDSGGGPEGEIRGEAERELDGGAGMEGGERGVPVAGLPVAGAFGGWPDAAAEVTVLDPCCGSGHFLVAAAGMLAAMREEEERLSPAEAADAPRQRLRPRTRREVRANRRFLPRVVGVEARRIPAHPRPARRVERDARRGNRRRVGRPRPRRPRTRKHSSRTPQTLPKRPRPWEPHRPGPRRRGEGLRRTGNHDARGRVRRGCRGASRPRPRKRRRWT